MMRLRLLGPIILLLGLTSHLDAQDPRLRARLDTATQRAVEQLTDSARRVGLPTEPLIQKALEGETKGAPGNRIVAAVAALIGDLARARQGLGADAAPEELQAGVFWLRAGGSVAHLAEVRRSAGGRAVAVPVAVSAELLGKGWPPDEATEALGRLFSARLSDAGFLSLRDQVAAAVRDGAGALPTVRAEVTKLTVNRGLP